MLNKDVFSIIFANLPEYYLYNARLVCKEWRKAIDELISRRCKMVSSTLSANAVIMKMASRGQFITAKKYAIMHGIKDYTKLALYGSLDNAESAGFMTEICLGDIRTEMWFLFLRMKQSILQSSDAVINEILIRLIIAKESLITNNLVSDIRPNTMKNLTRQLCQRGLLHIVAKANDDLMVKILDILALNKEYSLANNICNAYCRDYDFIRHHYLWRQNRYAFTYLAINSPDFSPDWLIERGEGNIGETLRWPFCISLLAENGFTIGPKLAIDILWACAFEPRVFDSLAETFGIGQVLLNKVRENVDQGLQSSSKGGHYDPISTESGFCRVCHDVGLEKSLHDCRSSVLKNCTAILGRYHYTFN